MGINEFIDSMLLALGSMDLTTLEPMSYDMFHPLFDSSWIERMEDVLSKKNQFGISNKELAKRISGLSHIRAQLFFLLLDLKSAKISLEQRKEIASFFHDVLLLKANDDPYGYNSNKKHTEQEIKDILQKDFQPGTVDAAKQLGRLYTASYHLTNGLYTDFYTDYGAENFGPYTLADSSILVIKHFHDLRPLLLWSRNTPCKTITIYCIYRDVKFSCDAISCHSAYEGDTLGGLTRYRVEIDGNASNDIETLQRITLKLEAHAVQQWKDLLQLDKESLKVKGLWMRCYTFKDLFDFLGVDWRPSPAMLNAVQGKEFAYNFWKPPQEGQRQYWEKVMHPEAEVYG